MTQRSIADNISHNQLYESDESIFLMHALNGGDCFVDVGANIGYFTIIASRLVGEYGSVYAFEPEQSNYERLLHNISLNKCANVNFYDCAVGADDRTVDLFVNSDNDGGHALWNPGEHSYNIQSRSRIILQPTRQIMLDTIFNTANPATKITVLKIDTEGYEHQVMIGALDTVLQHRVPFVMAEINRLGLRKSGSSETVFRSYMHNMGYIAYVAESIHEQGGRAYVQLPRLFVPMPENQEVVYNILFSLPGELDRLNLVLR
jgi:FkbM family methyltransferase